VIMEYSTICRLFISPEAGCFLTIQVEKWYISLEFK
jgi:hypothetical protein